LQLHQAEPVTIAKLRWLLGKATATLGQVAWSALSPKDVYAWRLTVPEGHRFEATQALRQVLNRAVTWGLIDDNPAKRGVPNPQRRAKEKRAVRVVAADRGDRRTARCGVRTNGRVRRSDRASTFGTVRARAS
jgi:hypothetical protein